MANIVNENESLGHDRTNHVNLRDLYSYNDPILQLIDLVKNYKDYITDIQKRWKDTMPALFKKMEAGDKGWAELCSGSADYQIPIKEYRSGVDQNDELLPDVLMSSVVQIIPPFDTMYSDEHADKMMDILQHYIRNQYFPIVSASISEADMIASYEKYDDTVDAYKSVGTIIDVYRRHTDYGAELYAIIMWTPNLPNADEATAICAHSFHGYISMADMLKSASCWFDANSGALSNFGVPIYAYVPSIMQSSILRACASVRNAVSVDLATDQYHINYVDELTMQYRKAVLELEDSRSLHMADESPMPPMQEEIIHTDEDVPVIDAKEDDHLGHLLHLYDDYSDIKGDDIPDPDISDAARIDTFSDGMRALPINGIDPDD